MWIQRLYNYTTPCKRRLLGNGRRTQLAAKGQIRLEKGLFATETIYSFEPRRDTLGITTDLAWIFHVRPGVKCHRQHF